MKKTARGPRQDEAAWRSLVARQVESGLSTVPFCAEVGVSSKSFYRWRARLSGPSSPPVVAAAASSPPAASGFIDLGGLRTGGPSRVEVRLDLGGGVLLHLVRE